MEAAGEADGAGLQRGALVIGGDQRAGGLLDRGVDRGDLMLLDDVMAERGSNGPDQFVLELGGQLDRAHGGLLEAIEAAAARDHQLHRLGGDLLVGVADQLEEQFVGAGRGRVRLPVTMLLDPADQDVGEIGIAERPGPFENRQRDRDVRGGECGVERGMAFETLGETGAEVVLKAMDEAAQQRRGGEALPFGEAGAVGQQQIGRGHGEALARRRQKQPRGVALIPPVARSGFRHGFSLARQG